jgi:hypothetical protein
MNGLGFKVTDTREISTISQAGNTTVVYRVWLVTDRGATGTLDVAKSDWNTESLPMLLATKAAELDLAFDMTKG